MNRRLSLVAAAFLFTGQAEAGSRAISAMTDDLQRIQTQVAHGDKAAYAAQIDQLKAIGKAIAAAGPETWREKREADALVVYVLSGGSVAEVAPLIRGDALPESKRLLVRAAVAYITSHEADAVGLFGAIDPAGLDRQVAGQAAFAKSVIETRRDPKAAITLLDWARLLAPGGLVEEAALRREVELLVEGANGARAARLTHEYAIRFGASLYAPDFFRQLARLLGESGLARDPASYPLFASAASALPTGLRLDFLLAVSRAAIVNGGFEAASAAAEDALREAPTNSPEQARARLYSSGARIFRGGSAQVDLEALADPRLDRSDRALLAAIQDAAAQLRRSPGPDAVEAQAASTGDEKFGGEADVIRDAEAALERTASLAAAARGSP